MTKMTIKHKAKMFQIVLQSWWRLLDSLPMWSHIGKLKHSFPTHNSHLCKEMQGNWVKVKLIPLSSAWAYLFFWITKRCQPSPTSRACDHIRKTQLSACGSLELLHEKFFLRPKPWPNTFKSKYGARSEWEFHLRLF